MQVLLTSGNSCQNERDLALALGLSASDMARLANDHTAREDKLRRRLLYLGTAAAIIYLAAVLS